MHLLKNRDERGISALYDQYSGSLFGIISRILPREEQAEDVLQKTFLKVWDNIDSFDRSSGALYTWMSTIARNAALDQRRLKSFKREEKTTSLDSIVYNGKVNTSSNASIDAERLMASVDEKYRIVLEYAYLRGYTHKEIAETLDMPLGTVKTRLRQAIVILRDELKREKALFIGGLGILLLIMFLI